jgi:hypothetical protein
MRRTSRSDPYKMSRKSSKISVTEAVTALRQNQFEVTETPLGVRVQKYGCAAVLFPHEGDTTDSVGAIFAYRERPGVVVAGEIARLLDRGYQKFLHISRFELPATADQLRAIHRFAEELTVVTGGVSLYNESLGTTSDLYQYDRVKGREEAGAAPARPWELAESH